MLAQGLPPFAFGVVSVTQAQAHAMNGNHAPTANAGSDQTVEASTNLMNVALDGSASSDPDGDALAYEWSEAGVSIGTLSVLNLSLALGTHVITLTVTDAHGLSDQDSMMVHVIDSQAPTFACSLGDGIWHAHDVTITCAATDSGSGLQDSADSSFSLTTNVAVGVETDNALTTSRVICDLANNCVKVGPIGGNMVDKKAPTIMLTSPLNTGYILNEVVLSSYHCTDEGAGVGTCVGTVLEGRAIDTASLGTKRFIVEAVDKVGNVGTKSIDYNVSYNTCLLYDSTRSVRSGSPLPIKISLCDVSGANVSSQSVVLTAVGVIFVSTSASELLQDTGNSNPDNNFRYDATLNGYVFNLSTQGYATGTYSLSFTAGGDSAIHSALFQVR